jgi:phasin family protein
MVDSRQFACRQMSVFPKRHRSQAPSPKKLPNDSPPSIDHQATPEQSTRISVMTNPTVEHTIKANNKAYQECRDASGTAVEQLTTAYQELAARNAENLTASIQSFAAVKTPTEFLALQQKLITEGVEAAVADGQRIADLTAAVFTAAFEPVRQRIEELQKTTLN